MRDDMVTAGESPLPVPARPSDEPRVRVAGLLDRMSTDTLAVLDVFLALGLLGVYLKLALMAPQWGAVARFLGHEPGQPLAAIEQIGFFASDIALNLIAIPILATGVLSVVSARLRVAAAGIAAGLMSLAYFVELRAGTEVGQYISGTVVRDFVGWGLANPASMLDYLTPASLAKLGLLLVSLVVIVVVARRARVAADPARRRYRLALGLPPAVLMTAAAGTTAVACAVRLPQSPLNTSAVELAVQALIARTDPVSAAAWVSLDDALASLRELTHTPPLDRSHAFAGREAGSDVLLFMMETGPAQALDYAAGAADLPAARRLLPRAFVGSRHYTAHPYSSDALFAVLSGTYPYGRTQLLGNLGRRDVNGLFSSMPADVGHRGVYLPSLYQIELDEAMYQAFGARMLYVADRHPRDPLRAIAERRAEALLRRFDAGGRLEPVARARLRDALFHDLQALERVKADITRAIAGGGRYAVMFFPEVGHGPWPQLRQGDDVLARGRLLMELQDEWLGELLDLIAAAGRFDRTVVAVTADHGLRTRAEYPPLRVGFITDVMFRVPLLVYAPRTLQAPMAIDAPTSHVDLAPTLLALAGGGDGAARMHGVPVWQRTPRHRIYVLGSAYGGADGFVEDGRYYMRQALSGAVYASDTFDFAGRHQVAPAGPVAAFVAGAIEQARDRQHALVARLREP
jgi:hypothetical protein